MSDSSKVAKWQSVGLVAAAFISTSGAVSSALIQTGWFAKIPSEATTSVSPPTATTAQATFAGFIEQVQAQSIAAAEISTPAANAIPAVTPAMYVSKPLVSQDLGKTKKELIDWNTIPRFLDRLK
jgi:hypothetical protein